VTGTCEHSNEFSGFIENGKISNNQILKWGKSTSEDNSRHLSFLMEYGSIKCELYGTLREK
jgi:hypothetical protein